MNNMKVLPVKYPRITCHQSMASLLSILECIPRTDEWMYSNFIITEAFTYIGGYGVGSVELVIDPSYDFSAFCPWFWKSEMSVETIAMFEPDIINFIMKCIDSGNYLLLFVDESKFSSMPDKTAFFHDIFIYGYDLEEKIFLTADFTFNHGKYQYEPVTFSDMKEAYASAVSSGKNLNNEGFAKLWHVRSDASYSLDIPLIKDSLKEYLDGYSYANRFSRTYHQAPLNKAGVKVYDSLIENLDKAGMRKCLHNLYDHKKLMLERIQYLEAKGYLSSGKDTYGSYPDIVNKAVLATNLYIKYGLTGKETLLPKIAGILSEIK